MNYLLWALQVVLAILYWNLGWDKSHLEWEMVKFGIMPLDMKGWVALITGTLFMIGALGLVLPWLTGIQKRLTPISAICLSVMMLLGCLGFAINGSWGNFFFTLVFIGLNVYVARRRWEELKKK